MKNTSTCGNLNAFDIIFTSNIWSHCVKSVRIRRYSGPYTKRYGGYSVRMRENNSEYGHAVSLTLIIRYKDNLRFCSYTGKYRSGKTRILRSINLANISITLISAKSKNKENVPSFL